MLRLWITEEPDQSNEGEPIRVWGRRRRSFITPGWARVPRDLARDICLAHLVSVLVITAKKRPENKDYSIDEVHQSRLGEDGGGQRLVNSC